MKKSLPENAHIEHLKAQAKDKLAEMRKIAPGAKLHQAQFELAQEYGFESWPKLVAHLANQLPQEIELRDAHRFIESGIRQGRYATIAKQLLERVPELAKSSLAASYVALQPLTLEAKYVNKNIGILDAPPLVYLCFSPLAKANPESYQTQIERLLAVGANPNASFTDPDFPEHPLSVLYAASSVAKNPIATKMLLDAGASADDNESLYHSAENFNYECLALVLPRATERDKHYAILRVLDFEDPNGLQMFLDAGADPNQNHALSHAIRKGRSIAIVEQLIRHGADPNLPDSDGYNACQYAYERALYDPEIFGPFVPNDEDALLAACWRGDVTEASRLKMNVCQMSPKRQKALTDACWLARADTIDAFFAAGFGHENRDDSKGTPLHCACFRGDLETVRAVLRHDPPLNDESDMHSAVPLQWAVYASEFYTDDPTRDYPAIVDELALAGSWRPSHLFGSPDVQVVLLRHWPELKLTIAPK